jgi:penicillin-binding protein 2
MGARVVLLLTLLVIGGAFFRLQVLRSNTYLLHSEENRLRAISVPAARGAMYDRAGRVVAENVPGYTVSLLPASRDSVRVSLERLVPWLDLDSARIASLMERFDRLPQRPLMVEHDASFEAVSALEERRPEFPRAVVEMRPRRRYPTGSDVGHVVGYTGEISESELSLPEFSDFEPGRIVGKSGLERSHEQRLGGRPGVRYVEVNALGSIVRGFGDRPAVEPVPGEDVTLGLDLELQAYTDSIFPEGRRGGVVALDPKTGEIVVLFSHPTFDPNDFVGGIDTETWRQLRDDPDRPLLNRVTRATYPPGSTWKLVVAAEAMRRGMVSIDERMDRTCRGGYRFGNRTFRCWKPDGHGSLSLSGAIQQSCNVYFYQLGLRLGLDAMIDGARRLGFSEPVGVDLPVESRGHFPSSREWFDDVYGPRGWTESVVLNLAIGQGENNQSLLRQALFYAALGTGESPIVPHLVSDPELEERRVDWSLELPEARRRELVEALRRVVNEPGGTAYPWRLDRWEMAGKTGTSQNPHGEPHSWFVGFAPAEDPEIVVASLVEFGHPDNTTSLAVPLASRVVRRFLETRYPAPRPDPAEIPGGSAGVVVPADGDADGRPGGDEP